MLIDMRSDTVTRPTAAMRKDMADAEVGDDVLDGDPTTRRLESTVAERLGKDAALFFPSGTMANQAAVWLLSAPGTEVLLDPLSHIVHSEMGGVAALCGAQILPVVCAGAVMNASDLLQAMRSPDDASAPEASLVCIENTHAWAGGQVVSLTRMRALRDVASAAHLPVHLDGARLWNAAAATGTSVAEFAACADTVMVSFSKGLGAPVGSALAGSRDAMRRVVRIRRRFGGAMRQSGVLAAAALHGLLHHIDRLPDDHAAARELFGVLDAAGLEGVSIVAPDTNIVMIDLPTSCAAAVVMRAAELGVAVSEWTPSRVRAVTHLDAPIQRVREAAPLLARAIADVLPG